MAVNKVLKGEGPPTLLLSNEFEGADGLKKKS